MITPELAYMYGLQRFGVKPGLDVMERLVEALGHPEKKFYSIHIAGTNGKGSTAAFLSSVWQAAGHKVGMYTSPHLVRFNERIRLNGVDISDEELAGLVAVVRKAAETIEATPALEGRASDDQNKWPPVRGFSAPEPSATVEGTHEHGERLTFFEFTTALAFVYFAQQNVEMAVIEVGMGGRLDATNVITPEVSVITTIGLDHTEVLGDTLRKITAEKAGIIKPGVPVVIGEKKEEVIEYLRGEAKKNHAPAAVVGEELRVGGVDASLSRQRFMVEGAVRGQFEIGLLGRHQVDNALTALTTILQLRQAGIEIPDAAMKNGLRETRWDGRMQVVSRRPLIIVDGAHNEDGLEALYEFIQDFPVHSVLVVAQKRGKHIPQLVEKVASLFAHVITTEGAYEPMPADKLARQLQRSAREVESIPHVDKAVERALALLPPDGFLLVTGSLYMIGGALQALARRNE